jgi:hypothetical protein
MAPHARAAIGAAIILLSACETRLPDPTTQGPTASPTPTATADPAAIEADLLFATSERCERSIPGGVVSIEFPSAWSTNDAIAEGDPSCVFFGPNLDHPTLEPPTDWAVVVGGVDGPPMFSHEWVSREETTVDGRPGWRVEEWVPSSSASGRETLQLVYWISLGASRNDGPNIVARSATEDAGHYALNKAVLDRMIATLAID